MFAGEAPGRLGAGRTGIPFSGDTAGARFERLLAEARLSRADIFVTNAALCLPLDMQGHNRRPAATEIAACSAWLDATISAVRPALVVALGGVALGALGRIEPHGLSLGQDAGRVVPWRRTRLTALYHPAARAQAHRPWSLQVQDWQGLAAILGTVERNRRTEEKIFGPGG
jgi:uracil-DNA glycosylase family 4